VVPVSYQLTDPNSGIQTDLVRDKLVCYVNDERVFCELKDDADPINRRIVLYFKKQPPATRDMFWITLTALDPLDENRDGFKYNPASSLGAYRLIVELMDGNNNDVWFT
jgi:hypothetical protein